MKKQILFLLCLMCTFAAIAQKEEVQSFKKFYVNVGLGGGISASSSFSMLYDYGGTSTDPTISIHPVGLGNGFNGLAAFGYRFNKYVGVEVSVNEFLGVPVSGDSTVNLLGASHAEVNIAGRMFSVIPAIVISAGLEKVNPYARFGLLIGALPTVYTKYNNDNVTTNPSTSEEVWNHYYGGVALGYAAAGGVSFKISKLINLFTELQFTHATWSPDHSEITKFTFTGVDKLSTLTTWDKKVDFVETRSINEPYDMSQPRKELRVTMPFSTIAINVGVTFKF
jgi:hypothetical protein